MKRFSIKSLLFALPFVCYFIMVTVVDPYDFFDLFNAIPYEKKKNISYKINHPLWKIIQYRKNPSANIILGDSRSDQLKTSEIQAITGENYFNLSYGGATLKEVCGTFWDVVKRVKLRRVYIGVNLNIYNGNNIRDRVSGAVATIESPFVHLVNRDVLAATMHVLRSVLFKKTVAIERPSMTRDDFWQYQLDVSTKRFYAAYKYPREIKKDLQKIVEYCNSHEIQVVFMIMPTHVSLQEKVPEYHLTEYHMKFINDLKKLGKVYDFNYRNKLTEARENFKDPYHAKKYVVHKVIREIWAGDKGFAKIYEDLS